MPSRLTTRTSRTTGRKGFTLVELLVVIGIIALLISILLPSLSKARKSANTVKSLAQLKQLNTAVMLYTNEWKGTLPYTGWGDFPGAVAQAGYPDWMYDNLNATANVFAPKDLQNGALYTYVTTAAIFRCPEDAGPWLQNQSQNICSYTMNGAMNNFATGARYKISTFKTMDAMFWEIGFMSSDGNDAANYPTEPITAHHNKGNALGFVDGHAEVWPVAKFNEELNYGPSQLWCAPDATNGGWDNNTAHAIAAQQ